MSSDSGDEEYAHDPDRFPLADSDEGEAGADGDTPADRRARSGEGGSDPGSADGLGTRGWILVGVVLVSFFVVPMAILFRPPQLPFEVAFLVLPLLPAFLLGGTAIWAMAGRAGE